MDLLLIPDESLISGNVCQAGGVMAYWSNGVADGTLNCVALIDINE